MDDLLSVALSEAGLDEFFVGSISGGESSNDVSNYSNSGQITGPVQFEIPSSSNSESHVQNINAHQSESIAQQHDQTTQNIEYVTNAQQPIEEHQIVSNDVSKDPPIIPPQARSIQVQRQPINPNSVQHNYDSFSSSGDMEYVQRSNLTKPSSTQVDTGLRRVAPRVHTPTSVPTFQQVVPNLNRQVVKRPLGQNGPQGGHFLRTVNENGETVYRTVRASNGTPTVVARNSPGTRVTINRESHTPTNQQQRIVVVRQQTPTGPVLVRHIATPNGRGQTILRRISRGSPISAARGTPGRAVYQNVRRASPQGQYYQSSPQSSRVAVAHSHVHTETGHQYLASSGPPATAPSQPRLVRTTPQQHPNRGHNMVQRMNVGGAQGTSLYRPLSTTQMIRTASTQGFPSNSRPGTPVGYVPVSVRGTPNRRMQGRTPVRGGLTRHPYSVPSMTGNSSYSNEGIMFAGNEQDKKQSSGLQMRPVGNVRKMEERFMNARHMGGADSEVMPVFEDLDRRTPVGQALKISNVSLPGPSSTSVSVNGSQSKAQASNQKVNEKKTAKDEMKAAMQAASERAQRDIDEEEENLGYAETYAEYRPSKLRSGLSHPDCVVETASLSSVAPPDIRYNVSVPEYLIDTGSISALQLEAVIYACQMHEQRLPSGERIGYLIGDGAGVGKGRTVACIIFENYLLGRKRAIWLSVSSDLKFDSERDLRDIGAGNITVYQLNKFKYAKISGKENGSVKKGVVFATYSSLIGECRTAKSKYRSRLKQLIQWFGPDYDGVIILDECHRAKNLVPTTGAKPTKTGRMVLELQKALPNARVVYASATGATEPRNMAYMTRLGLWGQGQAFPEFGDFINAVERRGVGAMEIVAMDMKQRGLYLARQLSFRGVSFRVEEIQLSDDFVHIYDESVKLWMEVRRQFQAVAQHLSEEERGSNKHLWGQFWACHQRFFKYLCIGAKVEACVKMTRQAISDGKCCVIGLQSTGEARTLEAIEEMGGELNEFVSTAKAVLQGLIEKHFPGDRGGCDPLSEFDRMFGEFGDKPKRRGRKPRAPMDMGFDIVDQLGLGPSTSYAKSMKSLENGPTAKRARRVSGASEQNSTTSSSGDDSDDNHEGLSEGTGDTDSDDGEEDEDVDLGDKQEDWINALMAEAASSSEESDNKDDSDSEKEASAPDIADEVSNMRRRLESGMSMGEEEFNPFACDFTTDDPWATKQQVVDEESPRKKKVVKSDEQLEEEKRRRKLRRKKRKKRKRREDKLAAELKQRRETESDAQKSTANDFMKASRLIDDAPEDINPSMVKAELLAAVERIGPKLPANTLDHLIDELGGPEFVAEMTGRKGRVVQREDGEVEYELRHTAADVPLELMNMDEKDKFMKGEKVIAIISEAASSGISLQSDRRAQNMRRRVHITLELPWSADKAIQQFGRTHRSNQVSAPEYVFLISELAGEKRFASIVAKRLESLGALTHGDRRATETRDLSQFNLDTKYGRAALEVLSKSVIGTLSPPLIPPPVDYKPGNFFEDMRLYMEGVGLLSKHANGQWVMEKEAVQISKFLNRILGLPVHAQNALFHYFSDILGELVTQAKHDGTYDMGIMDLGTGGDQVRKLETRVFLGRREKGSFRVEMHKIGVERGVSWEDAHATAKEHAQNEDGFYISNSLVGGKRVCSLVYGIGKKRLDTNARLYAITRPSTGRSPKLETYAELSKRFEKTDLETAERVWKEQYEGSSRMCQHTYIHGRCKNEAAGTYCEVGRRTRTYFVLSGSVLSVWPVVEEVISGGARDKNRASRMQVIRVRTEQEQKIVGLLVLPQYVRTLVAQLEEHCGRFFLDTKGNSLPDTPAPENKEEVPPVKAETIKEDRGFEDMPDFEFNTPATVSKIESVDVKKMDVDEVLW